MTEVPPCIMSLNVPTLDEFSLPDVPKVALGAVLFLEWGCMPMDDLVS